MVIYYLKPEDRAQRDVPLEGIEEVWTHEVERKGLPGKKVFAQFRKICEQVVK